MLVNDMIELYKLFLRETLIKKKNVKRMEIRQENSYTEILQQ